MGNSKEVLGRWTEYIGCLFEDDRVENPPMVSNFDCPPIIAAEVEYALKKMKSGKSPGLDNISTEMLKAIEFVFRETSKFHGLNIGGRKFNNIRYADDTVLLTENAEDLQLLAEAVNKHSNDADTWTLPQSKLKKMEAFEMWIYRRLAKISWKDKTNQEVCEHLGTRRELVNTIKTRKIKYFGYIKRHASFLKDVLEGKVEGSRPRGRQRRRWIDDITEWTGKDIHQCTVEAQDRAK
ncbi:endonuclease-reverse transcriptase [Elysia marginata]|uniref:Endonuclease-reverse transcriptase n=1 Tax=Elysia marginata TaxID=1093978 RepID=A0AAV4FFE6_9GAST|nr:endonuclease-reverse transcriptase [Elysia marginata]